MKSTCSTYIIKLTSFPQSTPGSHYMVAVKEILKSLHNTLHSLHNFKEINLNFQNDNKHALTKLYKVEL